MLSCIGDLFGQCGVTGATPWPEIVFCHVEINFLLLYRNYGEKIKEFNNQVLTQNWFKSDLLSIIFTIIQSQLSTLCSLENTKKMIGHRVGFRITDGLSLRNGTSFAFV